MVIDNNLSKIIHTYTINQDSNYKNNISTINYSINANNLLRLSKIWAKFNKIIYSFIELIFSISIVFINGDIRTNIVTSIFFLLYIIFFMYMMPINQKITDSSIKAWNNLCKYTNATFRYLNTIHIFNKNNENIKIFNEKSQDNKIKRNAMFNIKNFILGFIDFSFNIYYYIILIIIIKSIYEKKINPEFFTLFSILIHKTYHNLKDIINEYKIIEDVSVAVEAMKNIFFQPLISRESYDVNKNHLFTKNYNIKIW
jgi:ABC-type bacteriocin/lantibiotic exporter with double-glycine peptidase domain